MPTTAQPRGQQEEQLSKQVLTIFLLCHFLSLPLPHRCNPLGWEFGVDVRGRWAGQGSEFWWYSSILGRAGKKRSEGGRCGLYWYMASWPCHLLDSLTAHLCKALMLFPFKIIKGVTLVNRTPSEGLDPWGSHCGNVIGNLYRDMGL
jgi:hypothetical protein